MLQLYLLNIYVLKLSSDPPIFIYYKLYSLKRLNDLDWKDQLDFICNTFIYKDNDSYTESLIYLQNKLYEIDEKKYSNVIVYKY